jgi:hypothetical protein
MSHDRVYPREYLDHVEHLEKMNASPGSIFTSINHDGELLGVVSYPHYLRGVFKIILGIICCEPRIDADGTFHFSYGGINIFFLDAEHYRKALSLIQNLHHGSSPFKRDWVSNARYGVRSIKYGDTVIAKMVIAHGFCYPREVVNIEDVMPPSDDYNPELVPQEFLMQEELYPYTLYGNKGFVMIHCINEEVRAWISANLEQAMKMVTYK